MNDNLFSLIITIVNRGYADLVMEAAREAGAQGGTILHARGSGIHENEKFFGIAITPEKDVVLILIKTDQQQQVLHAITQRAGLNKEGNGLTFTLPVDDVSGIVHMMK